jgi:hypothetical protein
LIVSSKNYAAAQCFAEVLGLHRFSCASLRQYP